MERSVYFDAWFPRQHCYHPSLPPRRLRMVEELRELHATVLVWSALGGGSISLPYLEQEAFGEVDPRFRFYGFVNDAEFIAECDRHGIKVFGIVFEVQGWEFPVELSEGEDRILSLNEPRDVGTKAWLGLREFNQNRYPKLWPAFEQYFPDGLRTSDGEQVTDLFEEACSRDIHGRALHARWVEAPDREHVCHLMDRNHPAWREYLKGIIRIQVDAGVHGVQLDEAETPITALQYGGCFCADCVRGFREHLAALPDEARPAELDGVDLTAFHYGQWLLAQGYDFTENRESTPLFFEYLRFQRRQITRYFRELADYAREYGRSKGREVLVSGNFFNLFDHYYALEPDVDLIITEMRNTTYRQPAWYRYVAGFAGAKPVVVVENPYGGVVPELIDDLAVGRSYDRFRLALYEGAANGVSMSVPYGAWMGSVIEDSFTAPHALSVEIQGFLAANDELISSRTWSDVAVLYSVESNFARESGRVGTDNRRNEAGEERTPFWATCEALSDAVQPYDVVMLPDGELRADALEPAALAQYGTVVAPDCTHLTDRQADLLDAHLGRGGRLVVLGELGRNLPADRREALLGHAGTQSLGDEPLEPGTLPGGPQVVVRGDDDVAVTLQRIGDDVAVHVLRYGYVRDDDRVPRLDTLELELRLPRSFAAATAAAPDGATTVTSTVADGSHHLRMRDVGLYTIVHLTAAAD